MEGREKARHITPGRFLAKCRRVGRSGAPEFRGNFPPGPLVVEARRRRELLEAGVCAVQSLAWQKALAAAKPPALACTLVPSSSLAICTNCGLAKGLDTSPEGIRASETTTCCRNCGAATGEELFDDADGGDQPCSSSGNSIRFTGGGGALAEIRQVNELTRAKIDDRVLVLAADLLRKADGKRDHAEALSRALRSAAEQLNVPLDGAQIQAMFSLRDAHTGLSGFTVAATGRKSSRSHKLTYGNSPEEIPGLARTYLENFVAWAAGESSAHLDSVAALVRADLEGDGRFPQFARDFIEAAGVMGVGLRKQLRTRVPAVLAVLLKSLGAEDPPGACAEISMHGNLTRDPKKPRSKKITVLTLVNVTLAQRVNSSTSLYEAFIANWPRLAALFNAAGLPYPTSAAVARARAARNALGRDFAAISPRENSTRA